MISPSKPYLSRIERGLTFSRSRDSNLSRNRIIPRAQALDFWSSKSHSSWIKALVLFRYTNSTQWSRRNIIITWARYLPFFFRWRFFRLYRSWLRNKAISTRLTSEGWCEFFKNWLGVAFRQNIIRAWTYLRMRFRLIFLTACTLISFGSFLSFVYFWNRFDIIVIRSNTICLCSLIILFRIILHYKFSFFIFFIAKPLVHSWNWRSWWYTHSVDLSSLLFWFCFWLNKFLGYIIISRSRLQPWIILFEASCRR